jgi:ribosome-associated protein
MDQDALLTELRFSTSRSSGKGGQNVNKVESRVTLYFNVVESQLLTEEKKQKIQEKLASRITDEGVLQFSCEAERSQLLNKQTCIEKFFRLIEKALLPEKERRKTRPGHAAKEKRLKEKRIHAERKAGRSARFE